MDPWGTVIEDAGGVDSDGAVRTTPSILTCDIDSDRVNAVRQRMPIQEHRTIASASMRADPNEN